MTVVGQKSMPRHAVCPLSRPAGEGWGEGGSMGCTNLILPQAAKPPHPNLPPPDGGRDKVTAAARGRLKSKIWFQTTFFHNQTSASTPPPSFPRRRESIGNPKK